jgi:hypothetical protein
MRPSRTVQSSISLIFSNQRTVGSFLFWCFQFKLGIRESSIPVIYGILVMTSSGLLPFVDNQPHIGVWRLPKFKPQYFSSRDLDRIWRPRSSRARSAWTLGPISENHLGPVGVQTNGVTCQAVTEPTKASKIAELRDKLNEINVLRFDKLKDASTPIFTRCCTFALTLWSLHVKFFK